MVATEETTRDVAPCGKLAAIRTFIASIRDNSNVTVWLGLLAEQEWDTTDWETLAATVRTEIPDHPSYEEIMRVIRLKTSH